MFLMNCINTSASLLKVLLFSKKAPDLPLPSGEKCLVLGNGPSLRQTIEKHGDYLAAHPSLCVNTFCLSDEYLLLRPMYYVMLDPGLWFADNKLIDETMSAIKTKTSWTLHLIVPYEAKRSKLISSLGENSLIHIHYINYVVFKGFDSIAHSFYRKNKAMPQSQNVLVASLFLAINLGYKRIELFGADHSWHELLALNEDNIVCLKQVHFYENEAQVNYVPFYKAMHIDETFRMDEAFQAWAKVFHGYHRIRKYAESRDCLVYNASEKTYVDAFERIHI